MKIQQTNPVLRILSAVLIGVWLSLVSIGASADAAASDKTAAETKAPADDQRIWIDVRTKAEHFIDSIDNDARTDWEQIVTYVEAKFPDKKQPIGLYCRSGGRAGKAKAALEEAGYTNVVNAGSIDDARKARGISN